jgi:hypothetical protein
MIWIWESDDPAKSFISTLDLNSCGPKVVPIPKYLVLGVLGCVEIYDLELHGEVFLSHLLCHLCPGAGKSWEQSFHFVFALIFSARHYSQAPKNNILLYFVTDSSLRWVFH